jgi:uncharacterized protein with HEPN domain/predicted nucleotidyltransferase
MSTKHAVITPEQVLDRLTPQFEMLRRLGVKSLAVFGSVARGEAGPDSDVDLMIEFSGPATYDSYTDVKSLIEDTLSSNAQSSREGCRPSSGTRSLSSRDVKLYIEDIVEACGKITRYAEGLDANSFASDEKTFDAIMRNLEIIGEAIRHVPKEVQAMYPAVEWRKIAGFRDVAMHAYPTIDAEILWDIVRNKVPELQTQMAEILLNYFADD